MQDEIEGNDQIGGHNGFDICEYHDGPGELEVERQPNRKESQSCLFNINNINKPNEKERDESKPDEPNALHNLNVSAQNEENSVPSKPPRASTRAKHQQTSDCEITASSEEMDQTLECKFRKSSRPKSMDVSATPTNLTASIDMPTYENVHQNMEYFATGSQDGHDDDDDVNNEQVSIPTKDYFM